MINCFTLGHFSAHILSNMFTFEVRSIRDEPKNGDDLNVTNWINKPFDVVEAVSVKVLPSMTLTFDPLHIKFVRDVIVYVVYSFASANSKLLVNDTIKSVFREEAINIPTWFSKLMFCRKDTTLDITYDRIPNLQDDYIQTNKFNFLEQL